MTKEDYIQMSKALSTQVFFVADRATEIIREIVRKNADKEGYLNIEDYEDLWIQEDKSRVVYIYADNVDTFIGVQMEDDYFKDNDETQECFLFDLNPWDRIELADYLAKHF